MVLFDLSQGMRTAQVFINGGISASVSGLLSNTLFVSQIKK